MKKIVTLFAALFSFAAVFAHQYTQTVDGIVWYYNLIDDGKGGYNAEITYRGSSYHEYYDEYSGSLTIPSTLGGYSVTEIGDCAFYYCRSLTSVTIPDSVTTIGNGAFVGCCSLTSIMIPDSVTTICLSAFHETPFYNNQPDGLVILGNGCLHKYKGTCPSSITIPDSVTTIGDGAFSDCFSLTSVTIPDSVTTIGDYAFNYCSALTSIMIPDSVTTIGSFAFQDCRSLTSIMIPDSVTEIGSEAFANCSALNEVTILAKNPQIGVAAFADTPWYESKIMGLVLNGGATNTVTVKQEVVYYVLNSAQPQFVLPATYDTGFVNVIAEIKGGCVPIPATWTVNYPKFTEKFGSDFTKALTAKSGKIAAGGREMLVWEDYVAGTDPTNPNDKFTASMTIVDGKPVISWTPELDDARKALRKYTTYGKVKLTDAEWSVVSEGHEADYNFFKVAVEMK